MSNDAINRHDFIGWPKIARFSRECIVTEKIDGTNACICITENGDFLTGSRNRWITPEDDNYGFSKWAHDNKEELLKLGKGRHFGEWWGGGIQRGYGLDSKDKRFSLFNVIKWTSMDVVLPNCVNTVPILWRGNFEDFNIVKIINQLENYGSVAVPGYMNPEGIVVYHIAGNVSFKKTIKNDSGKNKDK